MNEIKVYEAEETDGIIERLKKLVENAYREGYGDACRHKTKQDGWEEALTKRDLEKMDV